jgi:hypothetical protein
MSDFDSTITTWLASYKSSTASLQSQHQGLYTELSQLQSADKATASADKLEEHVYKLVDVYAALHGYNVAVRHYQDTLYDRVKEAKTRSNDGDAVMAELKAISVEVEGTIASDLPVLEAT